MMVVADTILETRRRPCRLDAPEKTLRNQHAQGVVHRLKRYRTDFDSHGFCDDISRDVRASRNRSENRQPLRSDLDTALPEKFGRVGHHVRHYIPIMESLKTLKVRTLGGVLLWGLESSRLSAVVWQ